MAFANDGKLTAPGSVGFRVTGGAGFDNLAAAALTPVNPTLPFADNFATATDEQLGTTWGSEPATSG